MADATKLPITLRRFQWARPDAPNPRLALPIDADDANFSFTSEPLDEDGVLITGDFLFGLSSSGYVETVYAPPGSISGNNITGAIRGVDLSGLDYTTGNPTLAIAHSQDTPVFCNISAVDGLMIAGAIQGVIATGSNDQKVGNLQAADIKRTFANDQLDKPYDYYDESAKRIRYHMGSDSLSGGSELEGPIFKGTTVELNNIPELPANGMIAFDTTQGFTVFREGGAWIANQAGGGIPNGAPGVAGKFEEATQTQNDNGTQTGGSGATLVASPLVNARTVQKQEWSYATDTGAANAYVITLSPAPASYVAGQRFSFKAANANTGASTLNVNALGVKTIKKRGGLDNLEANDIRANQIVDVEYDGTNFQVVSTLGNPYLTQQTFENTDPYDNYYLFYSPLSGWAQDDLGGGSKSFDANQAGFTTGATSGNYERSVGRIPNIYGTDPLGLLFSDVSTGNQFIFELTYHDEVGPTNTEVRFGIAENISEAINDTAGEIQAKFRWINNQPSVTTGNGAGALTSTNIAVADNSKENVYRLIWTPGTDVKFYVNGSLVHTQASNIPLNSSTVNIFAFAAVKTTTNLAKSVTFGSIPYITWKR